MTEEKVQNPDTSNQIDEKPKQVVSDKANNKTTYYSGMIVKVHEKITETNTKGEEKERVQVFEGIIIAAKHGNETGATITVRKISNGVGVEKIFPIYSPSITKIEIVKEMQVRRAKLNYLRNPKYKRKMIEKKEKKK